MVLRLCGILLLVLAVSPVTAPFSTCDLTALLGGQAHGGAILQPKAASDDAVPAPQVSPALPVPCDESTLDPLRRGPEGRVDSARRTQLRV